MEGMIYYPLGSLLSVFRHIVGLQSFIHSSYIYIYIYMCVCEREREREREREGVCERERESLKR